MNRALLKEIVLAVLLLVAAVAVTVGVAMFDPAAGWIAAGVLGAGWAIVVIGIRAPRTESPGDL